MKLRLPVMLAPVGSLESFDAGGAATAGRGATEFGVPIIVSSVTKPGLEETAKAVAGPKIFQLYVRGDDAWVDDVVRRAMDAGYNAFCITVDTAAYSRRERDIAARFVKPWRTAATGHNYQAGFSWDNVKRFKDKASHPADPEGHRHSRGRCDRLRAWRRGGVCIEPRRPPARSRPWRDGRTARGDGRGARPGAGDDRRQLLRAAPTW